jgi:serine phosphatase RsbU (regulator of sigma subunit)
VLTLEFAALHFAAPERNRYRFRLEGFGDEWIDARAERRAATFTRLAPGDYVFRVQAANPDGAWNLEGARLAIRVLPPFWGTWWFRGLVGAAALALLAAVWTRHARAIGLRAELAAAHAAQMGIMPPADPELAGFEISGACLPAAEVGGDFFDYVWLEGTTPALAVVVGDVSGKGMRAAMAAAVSSGIVHARVHASSTLAEAMTRVNASIHRKVERPMFTALCVGALEPARRELVLVNAGLCPPVLVRGGRAELLESADPALPLGALRSVEYRSRTVALAPGDLLVFYTDGVPEARDRAGAQFGYESLAEWLSGQGPGELTARQLKEALLAEVARFSSGSRQHDDIAVVVVRVR